MDSRKAVIRILNTNDLFDPDFLEQFAQHQYQDGKGKDMENDLSHKTHGRIDQQGYRKRKGDILWEGCQQIDQDNNGPKWKGQHQGPKDTFAGESCQVCEKE